jgi:3-methylcrotonyl-CoA carboxylase beta subunit
MGSSTAGGAYVPAMADECIMVKEQGTLFLGGPPLVKAATGEDVDAETLGGAQMHCQTSGVADYLAENDEHALELTRSLLTHDSKSANNNSFINSAKKHIKPPRYPQSDILGILPEDLSQAFDMREIIARIVDDSYFDDFKALYGTTLVCAFAKIFGHPVGIVANQGILFAESALKGAHFIQLCQKRNIPLIFLQNITGFMVGQKYENGGIAKHGAKMVTAVSCATVPKLTVVMGGSFGAGNYAMCGRAYDPRFLWMWPQAKISVMGGQQAAKVLSQVALDKGDLAIDDRESFEQPLIDKYTEEGHALYSSARLWDDGIILPTETRRVLGMALDVVSQEKSKEANFGIFRM